MATVDGAAGSGQWLEKTLRYKDCEEPRYLYCGNQKTKTATGAGGQDSRRLGQLSSQISTVASTVVDFSSGKPV